MPTLLDVCFPNRCAGCGRRGSPLCAACAATARPAPSAPPPPLVDWWTACFVYEGAVREALARAKYRGERSALRVLAHELTPRLTDAPCTIDAVTWPPASRDRYARAGVDHAAVIARAVARDIGVRAHALVRRTDGRAQTGQAAVARRRGPALHAIGPLHGRTVLVIDDIATTGGTLTGVARALRNAGVQGVIAATIARTPRPDGTSERSAYTSGTTPSRAPPGGTWTSS